MINQQPDSNLESLNASEKNNLKSWVVIFSAALFFFYEFIQMNMTSSLAPYLLKTFSLTAEQLGSLSATYFYSAILFLLPAGQILDRFSPRKIILLALMTCIIGTFIFALSKQYWLTELSRFFTGIGSAFCFLSCIRIASRWFKPERMALVSGVVVTMAMLGGTVAQTPLTLLINYFNNWRYAILVDAVMGLIFWIIIFYTVQDYPAEKINLQHQEKSELQKFGYWRAMKSSYLKLSNWLCAFYTSFLNLPIFLIGGGGFGALYLEQVKHLSNLESSYPPMMIFFGTVIGSPIAGWISDSMGRRKLPMILGAISSLILILLIIYLQNISLIIYSILFFLLGFVSSTQIISYPVVSEINPRILTATSVSVVSFTALSGGAIFQPFFGYLMDNLGGYKIINNIHVYNYKAYHDAMLVMPITMLIALIFISFIQETYCRSILNK